MQSHMLKNSAGVLFGCVSDGNPKYLAQALRLLDSLRWFGGRMADADFMICVVGDCDEEYKAEFARRGAVIRIVECFSEKHPHSNKLRFFEQDESKGREAVVLLDCDTVIVQCPFEKIQGATGLRAKIADLPTVPSDVMSRLFEAAGLEMPPAKYKCTADGTPTIPYFNAGALIVSSHAVNELVPEWISRNRWLLENMELLGERKYFCEQASLSLAVAAKKYPFETMENEMNFPAHLHDERYLPFLDGVDPIIIHYHNLVDHEGYLKTTPYPFVNARIRRFNDRLREERRKDFNNRLFWNFRYNDYPDIGSGLGSRGSCAAYKRSVLSWNVRRYRPESVMDVGCGDMEVSSALPADGYLGIDLSEVIIERLKGFFPDRKYLAANFLTSDLQPADMVVCMDVLIHLDKADTYRRFVEKIVRLTKKAAIITGYDTPPPGGDFVYFHEPLSETLANLGARNVKKTGQYRNVAVFKFGPSVDAEEASGKPVYDGARSRVFLVGAMRSGTTLLAQLLGESPDIAHCPFELKDIWSKDGGVPMASPKTRDRDCLPLGPGDVKPGQADRLALAFSKRMAVARPESHAEEMIFLNKNPHLCNKLPFVQALFPKARFIFIRRHLPSVVASVKRLFEGVFQRQGTTHYWPNKRDDALPRCWSAYHSGEKIPPKLEKSRLFPGGDVSFIAEYWIESNMGIARFMAQSPEEERLLIEEEALISNPDETLASCRAFMESAHRDLAENVSEMDKERNKEWGSLLSAGEKLKLQSFIRLHQKDIGLIYGNESVADEYLKALE